MPDWQSWQLIIQKVLVVQRFKVLAKCKSGSKSSEKRALRLIINAIRSEFHAESIKGGLRARFGFPDHKTSTASKSHQKRPLRLIISATESESHAESI